MDNTDVPPLESVFLDRNFKFNSQQRKYLQSSEVSSERKIQPASKNVKDGVEGESNGFAGFKKGFLIKNDVKSTKRKDIQSNSLVNEEVQKVMKSKYPFIYNEDWLTEDLLKKIQSNKFLSTKFNDVNLMHKFKKLSDNPKVKASNVEYDAESARFFQEFSSILGDHFIKLGKEEEMKNEKEILMTASSSIVYEK